MRSPRWSGLIAAALAGWMSACTAAIGEPTPPMGSPGGPPGPSGGPGPGPGTDAGAGPAPLAEEPAPSVRYTRLSHEQWANAVRDLLRLDQVPAMAADFRADPSQSGFIFDGNAEAMEVDQVLWSSYQLAAGDLAESITADGAQLARILPPDTGDPDARARALITELGLRAHRRPLTAAEVERYLVIYRAGATLYDGVPAFEAGVRLVLEALLQSPYFLYRIETSASPAGELIPLEPFEIASRLSFVLWNTMPDDALFAAAASGTLADPAQRETLVRAMIDDPRAEAVVGRFHAQLLRVSKFASIAPASSVYAGSGRLPELARQENELFVRDIFASGRGYSHLLTSSETFVNDELAAIYGLSGNFGASFEKASLDPAQRKGVFTQVGFLAANATGVAPDPIHRGVFLTERIACNPLSAPPANIPPLPPPNGRTNRETVEDHTETPGTICASCHAILINPFGFPFESYDAVGRVRTEDNGFPVNTQADPLIGGERTPVTGAIDLIDRLAASEAAHECYAQHWVEFAAGRPEHPKDHGLVAKLGSASRGGASIKGMLLSLVTSPAFLNRSVEELP